MKAKTRQQIALEYGVNRKTLYQWLRKNGIALPRGLLTPYQQEIIYKRFGYPTEKRAMIQVEDNPIDSLITKKTFT